MVEQHKHSIQRKVSPHYLSHVSGTMQDVYDSHFMADLIAVGDVETWKRRLTWLLTGD